MLHDDKTLPLALPDPNEEGIEDPRFWLETNDFAELASINKSTARDAIARCYTGGTWRKTSLIVRIVDSVGGNAGKAYQVFAPSLPVDLSQAWRKANPELFPEAPAAAPSFEPETAAEKLYQRRLEVADFRFGIIMPALRLGPGTGRAETIRGICSKTYEAPSGKAFKPCVATVNDWLARYHKAGGKQGLIPSARSDANAQRVRISRVFDNACPLPDEKKAGFETKIIDFIKGMYKDTWTSAPKICLLASAQLVNLCKAEGWAQATLKNCSVGLAMVKKYKVFRQHKIMMDDAQTWADIYQPRVHRSSAGLRPMDIVMADVHPVDILKEREDGTTATARMISWYDVATGRYMADYVLLGPRQGVTQAHIAASFVRMVKAWGLPRRLYLDNGSEYQWAAMLEGFKKLTWRYPNADRDVAIIDRNDASNLLEDLGPSAIAHETEIDPKDDCVTRAIPHNPQGKAPKEGLFGVLERTVFCMIPGWIGGDRMRKKTHKLGKQPRAFDGTWEEFKAAMENASAFYHSIRQKNGKVQSPNERYSEACKEGFNVFHVSESILFVSFSEAARYKVQHDGIAIGTLRYFDNYMTNPGVIGSRVMVYVAKWDPSRIGIEKADGSILFAALDKEYGFLEKAGAEESARRAGEVRRQLREIGKGVTKGDAMTAMKAFNEQCAPATEAGIIQAFPANKLDMEAVKAGRKPKVDKEPVVISELGADQYFDEKAGKIIDLPPRKRPRRDEDQPTFTAEEDVAYWKAKRHAALNK